MVVVRFFQVEHDPDVNSRHSLGIGREAQRAFPRRQLAIVDDQPPPRICPDANPCDRVCGSRGCGRVLESIAGACSSQAYAITAILETLFDNGCTHLLDDRTQLFWLVSAIASLPGGSDCIRVVADRLALGQDVTSRPSDPIEEAWMHLHAIRWDYHARLHTARDESPTEADWDNYVDAWRILQGLIPIERRQQLMPEEADL